MRSIGSRGRRRALLVLAALPIARLGAAADIEEQRTGGPYVPTPQVVVDEMLRIGRVGAGDFVFDLGSGDGVIVLTAAQKLKARGLGVDIDPDLVRQSNDQAHRLGVADRAAFEVQDVFKANLSRATVVTLYLVPEMMLSLRRKLLAELKPGTRVVSHDYDFDDWRPDDEYTWTVPEKEAVNGVPRATVYLWVVPARVAGRWAMRTTGAGGGADHELILRQEFQNFSGVDSLGARLSMTRLRGTEIFFARPVTGGRQIFRGSVAGDSMAGEVELAGGKGIAKWTARRLTG